MLSRRRFGAGREQIRETRDWVLPGNDGVCAFWPEAAKNLPFAVQRFRAGKRWHPPTGNPNKARQAARSRRQVRDWESRNAPAWTLGCGSSRVAPRMVVRGVKPRFAGFAKRHGLGTPPVNIHRNARTTPNMRADCLAPPSGRNAACHFLNGGGAASRRCIAVRVRRGTLRFRADNHSNSSPSYHQA